MRAVVIGGGIAGTTTAIALAKAGIEAVVHEAYGHDSDGVGAWLTLASNGIDAVGTLGLGAAVRAGGFPTPRMRLVNQNGRALAEFPFGGVRLDGEPGVMNFCFGRRCFLGYAIAPDGDVWWFANPPAPQERDPAELAAIPEAQWRRRLLDLFAGDDLPAAELIAASEHVF